MKVTCIFDQKWFRYSGICKSHQNRLSEEKAPRHRRNTLSFHNYETMITVICIQSKYSFNNHLRHVKHLLLHYSYYSRQALNRLRNALLFLVSEDRTWCYFWINFFINLRGPVRRKDLHKPIDPCRHPRASVSFGNDNNYRAHSWIFLATESGLSGRAAFAAVLDVWGSRCKFHSYSTLITRKLAKHVCKISTQHTSHPCI